MDLDTDLQTLNWQELNSLNERLMVKLFQTNCRVMNWTIEVVGKLQDSGKDQGKGYDELTEMVENQLTLGDLLIDILGYTPDEKPPDES